jgi:hypothetical protein
MLTLHDAPSGDLTHIQAIADMGHGHADSRPRRRRN